MVHNDQVVTAKVAALWMLISYLKVGLFETVELFMNSAVHIICQYNAKYLAAYIPPRSFILLQFSTDSLVVFTEESPIVRAGLPLRNVLRLSIPSS